MIKLALLFIFLAVQGAHALNLAQIRTAIRRNMRDTQTNTGDRKYQDDVLLDMINEAQREITNITWLSEKTTEYVLAPRTTYYNLPDDTINVSQVQFKPANGSWYDLLETSRDELKRKSPSWTQVSGAPFSYYIDQSSYSNISSSSNLRISYIPIPTSASTGTVKVIYLNQVDNLAQDTDIPFNGKRHLFSYHSSIIFYVTMRLKATEGRGDEAALYSEMYKAEIAIMRDRLGRLVNYRPGATVSQ